MMKVTPDDAPGRAEPAGGRGILAGQGRPGRTREAGRD
jgi:hypothetical protein